MQNMWQAVAVAREMADAEKQDKDTQRGKLEQRIAVVEQLIDAGQLDRAEVAASGIQWQPDATRSQRSETEATLMAQYAQRRDALLAVIHRKLKPCP
jgi:hypothetical protein